MNKFKRWLIRKLGGFTERERVIPEVVRSTAPIVRLSDMIALPNDYLDHITVTELDSFIKEELGHRLGNMLIKENYVDITYERSDTGISIIIRGTIYVAKKTS